MGMFRATRGPAFWARAFAVVIAAIGILGIGAVAAQEATPIPSFVSVTCDPASVDGTTTCVFSAPGADQLLVPATAICGELLSSSGTAASGGFSSTPGSSSVIVVLANPSSVGGTADYTLVMDGTTSIVAGSAIACADSTAPPAPSATSTVEGAFGVPGVQSTEQPADTGPAGAIAAVPIPEESTPTPEAPLQATAIATDSTSPADGISPQETSGQSATSPEPAPSPGSEPAQIGGTTPTAPAATPVD